MPDPEITFQVRESPEGGYQARADSIFTEADDWEHHDAGRRALPL